MRLQTTGLEETPGISLVRSLRAFLYLQLKPNFTSGLTLKARCAGSGIDIVLDKFVSLNKELQAKPTEPGRFQYNRDWEVWADDVETKNWAAKPLCSHFQSLNVNLHIADADWAGTDNSLYAKVGESRFLIARHPSRREVFTVDVGLQKAYSTKLVPVPKVELVGIVSEGGNDAVLPKGKKRTKPRQRAC